MQYNSHATNQDLVSLLNDLTGMDSNVYPLVAKTRDMNKASKDIWTWIFSAYGGWEYDDSNNTSDFPASKATLTSGQKDYALPSDALTVRAVEVLQGGVWYELSPATEEQIRQVQAEPEFLKVSSRPRYYVPYANSVKLYPAPDYTAASSLRVSFDRGSTDFASTDTTKTPGFSSQFHEAVAYGAAVQFCTYKQLPQLQALGQVWQDYKQRIIDFYSSRYQQLFPPRMTVNDQVQEYQ
jgi:hypothetical protein